MAVVVPKDELKLPAETVGLNGDLLFLGDHTPASLNEAGEDFS